MVWALQGAGEVFAQSSEMAEKSAETAKKILTAIVDRDKMRELCRLGSLFFEIKKVENRLETAIAELCKTRRSQTLEFEMLCLKEAFINPPYPDDDFIEGTQFIYFRLKAISQHRHFAPGEESILEETLKSVRSYAERINTRSEEIRQQEPGVRVIKTRPG